MKFVVLSSILPIGMNIFRNDLHINYDLKIEWLKLDFVIGKLVQCLIPHKSHNMGSLSVVFIFKSILGRIKKGLPQNVL